MSRVVLRPTIASDLPFVIDEPLPYRIKTITAVLYDALSDSRHDGGTVVGIGGLAFPPDGPAVAFAQVAPPLAVPQREGHPRTVLPVATRFPVAFHRAGLAVMQMMRDCGVREVVATADSPRIQSISPAADRRQGSVRVDTRRRNDLMPP
jgi:hypothetical protein